MLCLHVLSYVYPTQTPSNVVSGTGLSTLSVNENIELKKEKQSNQT